MRHLGNGSSAFSDGSIRMICYCSIMTGPVVFKVGKNRVCSVMDASVVVHPCIDNASCNKALVPSVDKRQRIERFVREWGVSVTSVLIFQSSVRLSNNGPTQPYLFWRVTSTHLASRVVAVRTVEENRPMPRHHFTIGYIVVPDVICPHFAVVNTSELGHGDGFKTERRLCQEPRGTYLSLLATHLVEAESRSAAKRIS